MFSRHKQVDGNFYEVFLFFWWIFLRRKSTRARGNLGTQEIGRLICIAVTGSSGTLIFARYHPGRVRFFWKGASSFWWPPSERVHQKIVNVIHFLLRRRDNPSRTLPRAHPRPPPTTVRDGVLTLPQCRATTVSKPHNSLTPLTPKIAVF